MAENAQTEVNTGAQIDYEAEYNKMVAERDSYKAEAEKQKRMKDQYATENADYKKKAEAQMSDEEKRAKEMQDLIDRATNAEKKMAEMEHKQSGLENGFTADEVAKLAGSNVDFKVLKEIVSARVEEAVKSAKAEATKSSTAETLLGNGTTNGETKSDFQKHQESKQNKSTIVEL